MATDTVKLRGEGNVVWEIGLPLTEVYVDQLVKRALIPIDETEHEKVAYLLEQQPAEAEAEEPGAEPQTLAERIDAVATHAEANELAAELAVEGFEDKKPPLDEKRAALRAKASEQA